jgi:hypothetical protein
VFCALVVLRALKVPCRPPDVPPTSGRLLRRHLGYRNLDVAPAGYLDQLLAEVDRVRARGVNGR